MAITYRITERDYLKAQRLATPSWFRYLPYPVALLLLLVAYGMTRYDSDGPFLVVAGVIIIAMLLVGLPLYVRSFHKKVYRGSIDLQEDCALEFDEGSVSWTGRRSRFKMAWNELVKWKQSKDLILVFSSPVMMYVVPKRVLLEHGVLEQLVGYLQRILPEQ